MDPASTLPAMQLFDLSGQNVLITGATRGIGAACALALAQAGASICFAVRPGTDVDALSVVQEVRAWQSQQPSSSQTAEKAYVKAVECDLADLDSVRGLFGRALEAMDGHIDVLVNCGGIQRRAPCVDFGEDMWDEVMNVNLKACWLLSQAAGRHMVPRRSGKIINFCSLLTFQGGFTVPAYAAAKGALGQLTKALSNEWSKENVQVNGIVPGYIATEMNEKLLADPVRLRQISERIPAGRWGDPKDFAGPILFLASKASQYVCGELLVVDGGWMGR